MSDDSDFEAHLAVLREKFRERLAVYRQMLLTERQTFAVSPDGDCVRRLRAIAHDLCGSAGTFGHADVSEAAAELEMAADQVLEGTAHFEFVITPLRQLIREVELAL